MQGVLLYPRSTAYASRHALHGTRFTTPSCKSPYIDIYLGILGRLLYLCAAAHASQSKMKREETTSDIQQPTTGNAKHRKH